MRIKNGKAVKSFNDLAIISRQKRSLKPLDENETKLLLSGKVDAASILSCKTMEESETKNIVEDTVFDSFKNADGLLPVRKFLTALTSTGIRRRDPRLKEMITQLNVIYKLNQENGTSDSIFLDRNEFRTIVKPNIHLVSKALKHELVVADFKDLTQEIENVYWKCKNINGGQVASYIPQLAKYDPEYWGVSLCTVDGQRHSIGDTDVPFTIQSAGKPLNYGLALSNLGAEAVHNYIGQEPSGRMFNELVLDCSSKPHNPMINAGAIVTCSLLLYLVENKMNVAEKFDWMCQHYKALAGGEYLGFNNAIFMSEREAADRNYAIGFYMKENKCFPPNGQLRDIMDFYFQMCSLDVTCETLSVIASTLANGGICPITERRVLDSSAVRNVLSLMHSCGMYDYSGQFAFKVGLPAKSGVSGCTMVVIPNVMGFCLWSPPLDVYGNSVRGVKFCEEMVRTFNFHNYDNLRHQTKKKDPRAFKRDAEASQILSLLHGAGGGDLAALRRAYMTGVNMQSANCESRTALHIAAAQGHYECVEFLLNICQVNPSPSDRWGRTPLDEATTFQHPKVVEILSKFQGFSQDVQEIKPQSDTDSLLENCNGYHDEVNTCC